jgi:hypothetical protein
MNVLIAILILSVYTLAMIKIIGGIPPSLSESVFWLKKKDRFIWTLVLFLVCFLCVPTLLDKSLEGTQFLAFLAIAGLAFVGAAPLVWADEDEMQFQVHQWGAIVCAACSQILLALNMPLLLLCWLPFIIAGFVIKWKKWKTMIFWGEMVCFFSTFAYCLI